MSLFHPDAATFSALKSTPKTILITGGCSGIGLSTAELLSSLNPSHNLILLDLQAPPSSFQHNSAHLLYHACNITSWAAQGDGFEAGFQKFGRIDVVLVNAGIGEYADQFFSDERDASGRLAAPDHRTITVDLNAAAETTKLAIHYLRKNGAAGGSIVLTASIAGYLASGGMPMYSAAKHGVLGLMRALKRDCKKLGISISAVAPGLTITPMLTLDGKAVDEVSKKGPVGQKPDDPTAHLQNAGIPLNKASSVALAICWLLNGGIRASGAGIFVQGNQFVDLEKGMAESREVWMGREMLDVFNGTKKALL